MLSRRRFLVVVAAALASFLAACAAAIRSNAPVPSPSRPFRPSPSAPPVTPQDLENATPKIRRNDIVMINTGSHRNYGDNPDYFAYSPGLYKEAADALRLASSPLWVRAYFQYGVTRYYARDIAGATAIIEHALRESRRLGQGSVAGVRHRTQSCPTRTVSPPAAGPTEGCQKTGVPGASSNVLRGTTGASHGEYPTISPCSASCHSLAAPNFS